MITVDQNKLNQINLEKRRSELQSNLSKSDFRMTMDYWNQMTEADQKHWQSLRKNWRQEIRGINIQLGT